MSVVDDAKQAILDLHELTKGLGDGVTPDVQSILGIHSRMVRLHMDLGVEMCQRFGAKERAYLARKIAQATEHLHGRRTLNLTSKDAEEAAVVRVRQEHLEEIDRMEEY